MSDIDMLRRDMVNRLTMSGSLRSLPWIHAFATVPRHLFLPRLFRQSGDYSGWLAVGERDTGWLEMVYRDATWVTQLDNDPIRWQTAYETGNPVTGVPTSSSTAPGLMALMLEALDVDDGAKTLEIGTGTGYNAGLLCHRLRSRLVTSVEVDPAVADTARAALLACGYAPTLIVDDGTAGYPGNAPYDRIIATCSTPTIPTSWTAQLAPGGLLLTNLHRDLGGGALALLRRDVHGHVEGRFLAEYGGFMPVRSDPPADAQDRLVAALAVDDVKATTRLAEVRADDLDHPDFGMLVALRMPGVASLEFEPVTGRQRWLLAGDGCWASIEYTTRTVTQHGHRALWDEVETLHRRWTGAGSPIRERFGVTVTDTGVHHFWLDNPDEVWWTEMD